MLFRDQVGKMSARSSPRPSVLPEHSSWQRLERRTRKRWRVRSITTTRHVIRIETRLLMVQILSLCSFRGLLQKFGEERDSPSFTLNVRLPLYLVELVRRAPFHKDQTRERGGLPFVFLWPTWSIIPWFVSRGNPERHYHNSYYLRKV